MTNLILLTTAAAALLLAALELAARWWLRARAEYYVLPPGLRLHLRPDREAFPRLEPRVRFEVNREGERGRELPRRRAGLYRVLVAGGSQAECYLLDQDTSWPGAVERLLQTPDSRRLLHASRVHVGNIARSGVGSEALDLVFERVLPRYPRLQAIVVLVGASDVLRWLEEGAPPAASSPVRPTDIFRWHPHGPFAWHPRRLAVVEAVNRARRRWLQPIEAHDRAGRWVSAARESRARAREIRTTVADPTPMLDHFDRHFRTLLGRAKAHADRVIVVRQPWFDKEYTAEEAAQMWHGGAGPVWEREVTVYYSFAVVSRLMRLLDARAAAAAEALDVEHIDLMPVLERSLNTYYDCFHFTPSGAQAVAEVVAERIVGHAFAGEAMRRRATQARAIEQDLALARCVDSPAS